MGVLRHMHWDKAGDVAPSLYTMGKGCQDPEYMFTEPERAGDPSSNGDASPLESVKSGRARFELQGLTHDGGLLLNFSYDAPEEQTLPSSSPRRMTAAPQVHGIEAPGGLLFDGQQPTVAVAAKPQNRGIPDDEPGTTGYSGTASPSTDSQAQDRGEETLAPGGLGAVDGATQSRPMRGDDQESALSAGQKAPDSGAESGIDVSVPDYKAGLSAVAALPLVGEQSAEMQPIYIDAGSAPRILISKGAGGPTVGTRHEHVGHVAPPPGALRQDASHQPQDALRPAGAAQAAPPRSEDITRGAPGDSLGKDSQATLVSAAEKGAPEGAKTQGGSPDTGSVGGGDGTEGREAFAEAAQETAHAAAVKATEVQLDEAAEAGHEACVIPPLRIAILVAGTRGDVQPFVALALALKAYGHTVRLATHAPYKEAIEVFGLRFFPLGGDPQVLSDFIVRNRGVWPSSPKDALTNIKQVEEIVRSTYAACTEPDPGEGGEPFTAQAIIANPPVYGHIHCAEKLRIPLHMVFTMPWSPTKAFPHPLARLANKPVKGRIMGLRNQLSYVVVEELIWRGLEPAINRFRTEVLELEPLRLGNSRPHLLSAYQVPFSYCWSEALVPKPDDWGPELDIVGYLFLNESERLSYEPPPELADFLAAGPPPVYIGFGSLMVDDPKSLTSIILEAAERTGQRILLSRGWGKLGEGFELPPSVLLLDNSPHDWLLPRCSAVVHHGGAGTTAAGLLAGCPTTVIYFFGDQPFWGGACARAAVGPLPIPVDALSADSLAASLDFMQRPEVIAAAKEISEKIRKEDGLASAVASFHRHLPWDKMSANGGQPAAVCWDLAEPSYGGAVSEAAAGVAGVFKHPYAGAQEEGVKGALKGVAKGVWGLGSRPMKGLRLAASKARRQMTGSSRNGNATGDSFYIVPEPIEGQEILMDPGSDMAAVTSPSTGRPAKGADHAAGLSMDRRSSLVSFTLKPLEDSGEEG